MSASSFIVVLACIFSAIKAEITLADVSKIKDQLCGCDFETSFGSVEQTYDVPYYNSSMYAVVTVSGLEQAYVLDIKQKGCETMFTFKVPELILVGDSIATIYRPEEWPVKIKTVTVFILCDVVVSVLMKGHQRLVSSYIGSVKLLDAGVGALTVAAQNPLVQQAISDAYASPDILARERMASGGYAVVDTLLTKLCRSYSPKYSKL